MSSSVIQVSSVYCGIFLFIGIDDIVDIGIASKLNCNQVVRNVQTILDIKKVKENVKKIFSANSLLAHFEKSV